MALRYECAVLIVDMMNEKLLQSLASAKTVDEVQAALDAEGCEIVPAAGKASGEPPAIGLEVEMEPPGEKEPAGDETGADAGGSEDSGSESFADFSKKALRKNMDKLDKSKSKGGYDG